MRTLTIILVAAAGGIVLGLIIRAVLIAWVDDYWFKDHSINHPKYRGKTKNPNHWTKGP